ncbi:pyrroline-5-carboxylate reductase [Batrachochytrium salamandrivorans]|nr:pyrroline-5-carboxylate reductase [Batrachochytrium salamandrivorans]
MTDFTGLRIGFIGGGNMAGAIIGGLLQAGYHASNIVVSEPWEEARKRLTQQFKVHVTTDNTAAVSFPQGQGQPVDVLILAVKPQVMKDVAEGIAQSVNTHHPLIISIAAGITLPDLARWLQGSSPSSKPAAIVRCMPNTPALVVEGATGVYAAPSVLPEQKEMAFAVLKSVSKRNYWVDSEALLDVVTGGAGRMLDSTGEDPAELRRKVTSPNGTTEAALKSLEGSGIRAIFAEAVQRATERSAELGNLLGKQ